MNALGVEQHFGCNKCGGPLLKYKNKTAKSLRPSETYFWHCFLCGNDYSNKRNTFTLYKSTWWEAHPWLVVLALSGAALAFQLIYESLK